jgi:peptide/nickel transport system substrate-binding protein
MMARLRVRGPLVVAVVVVVSVVLAGPSTGASTRAAQPAHGGTLNLVWSVDVTNWDPINTQGVPNFESPGMFALYDNLFYVDPATLQLQPRLGLSLTTPDNGATWTLKLRPNVKFSDGTAFDAEAVRFNWARIADPATNARSAASAVVIQSMEVVDPLTLRVTLKSADPNWNQRVAYNLQYIVSPTAMKSLGAAAFGLKPVGAGPFLLKDWVAQSTSTFVRNPNYWEKGRPYLDELVIKQIPDDSQRYNTMTTGGGDVTLEGTYQNIQQFRQQPSKWAIEQTPGNGGGWAMGMNTQAAPFNDVRVRQALSLVLDSAEIVQRANAGDHDAVVTTVDRKGTPFYDPKLKLPKTDPAAAQKLIDAYVADNGGKPVQFTYLAFPTPALTRVAETIQAILSSKLKNVDMKIEVLGSLEVVARYRARNYQAASFGVRWIDPAIDVANTFLSTSALNFFRFNNPAVDTAARQLLTAPDLKTKAQAHHTIIENVLKDVPVIWLYRFQIFSVDNKSVVKNWNLYYDIRPLLDQVRVPTKR